MERLSPLDASFLQLESARTPMHISSLAIYDGPAPADEELIAMLDRRMPLVPRFRDRLVQVPGGGHRPVWVSDPDFDITAHLQRIRVPEPTEASLLSIVGRLLSQPLCRTRPLWEMWLIEGLRNERFAVLSKTHHSLWDGVSGVDLHAVLLDATPDAKLTDEPEFGWNEVERVPSSLELVADAIEDRTRETLRLAGTVLGAVRDPRKTIRDATTFARGASELARSVLRPAPRTPLNRTISSRRRYALARGSLADAKQLKHTLGVTVNDAILAAVAGGLRVWNEHRRRRPKDVRVMVPVSVRTDEDDTLGNRVAMVVIELPVSEPDPLARVERIHASMQEAKSSGAVAAADAIVRMSSVLPTAGIAAITQLQSRFRAFNLLVTNIPGPQFPLYLLGRRLRELYPQAPLAANQGLAVGALTYDGKIGFGVLGDHDLVPDIDVLARGIESSLRDITWDGTRDVAIPTPVRELALVGR
jgi:diacylglycerol O-acyltransferase